MPAPLTTAITSNEDETLFYLSRASSVPARTRDRAAAIRMSSQGWTVKLIAKYFKWHSQTVRDTIHRWNSQGLAGLWDAPGRGAKKKWSQKDLEHLKKCLDEPRAYNAKQLSVKLAVDCLVFLGSAQIRRILKTAKLVWKRTRKSNLDKQDPEKKRIKQADLSFLLMAESEGYVRLKYLDESGFSPWPEICYTYATKGEQKRMEQSKKRGRRVSILGILEPKILLMDWLSVDLKALLILKC